MKKDRINDLKKFEDNIGYKFKDIELLNLAFTHSSFSNENKSFPDHNERLEFLGDSVVNLITTDLLYTELNNLPEGELTKIRATLVCENSFAKAGKELDIPRYLLLGKGEEMSGGRTRESLIADAFEAFCGAIYLDGGFNSVKNLLTKRFKENIMFDIRNHNIFLDYKTALQEKYHKKYRSKVKYILTKEEGPDHNKLFYISVYSDRGNIGSGSGKSKKEAEHNAAKDALIKLGFIDG
ncbi:MAG: ribonuclease III [Tissierellia bacterium]|nr:ribonuclease III [Tissierellia bacterium]